MLIVPHIPGTRGTDDSSPPRRVQSVAHYGLGKGPRGRHVLPIDPQGRERYTREMTRFFDMADHARLPQRFTRENRSVLARRH
ncbi:MAG: hypothetical protein EA339_05655 [Rhodobacteraceae bacterium]|nr:MAG: hypothetical protein EA339_05655 [Paracoccaceae bacterium]